MQKWTFLVVACVESGVKVTFRHFGHVIFVEKFAAIAFFAKTSKPMLTNNGFVASNVPENAQKLRKNRRKTEKTLF